MDRKEGLPEVPHREGALQDLWGTDFQGVMVGSPQMWVWPQLVFGGSPPSPIVIGGPFHQAKPLPSPPSPSLFPPPPLALFARLREGAAQAGGGGRGPRAQGGRGGGGLQPALGARPTSGGTRYGLRGSGEGVGGGPLRLIFGAGLFFGA